MKKFIMIMIVVMMLIPMFTMPVFATLTPGYWKNHVEDWDRYLGDPPLPTDPFINGPDAEFSWLDALGTPPKGGDPWYNLARAYSAAYLNGMADWDGTVVQDDIEEVAQLLMDYDPGTFEKNSPDYIMARFWATTLDNWNNDIW